jgi:putative membrane protein
VIWGIIVLVRYLNTPDRQGPPSDQGSKSPDSILAERFARGEIDEGEYAHKREVLRSGDPGAHPTGTEDASRERQGESVTR